MKNFAIHFFLLGLAGLTLATFGARAQSVQPEPSLRWSQRLTTLPLTPLRAETAPTAGAQAESTKTRLRAAFQQRGLVPTVALAHFQLHTDSVFYQPGRSDHHGWVEGSWQWQGETFYTYDAAGRAIHYATTAADSTTHVTQVGYDDQGTRVLYVSMLDEGMGFDTIFAEQHLVMRNLAGQVTQHLIEAWQDDAWHPTWQEVSTYDGMGVRLQATYSQWTGPERFDWQVTYAYNALGELARIVRSAWSGLSWLPYSRTTLAYQDGVLVEKVAEWRQGNQWVNSYRHVYTLNENREWNSVTEATWQDSAWVDAYREVGMAWHHWVSDWARAWDEGVLTSVTGQVYTDNAWVNTHRYTATHTPAFAVETEEVWDSTGWQPDLRASRFWDAHGQCTRDLRESWNQGASAWEAAEDTRWLFIYDDDLNITRLVTQRLGELGALVNENRFDYFDFQTFTSLHQALRAVDVTAYPNPTRDHVRLDGHWAQPLAGQLFDATGRPVRTFSDLLPGQSLDTRGLPAGVYHLHLHNATQRASQRILKQ